MSNWLEVDSVILEFGTRRVLQDVYLKSETGKVTGVLGRNGTGKSSLFKILYGELTPSSKSVRINGNALVASYRSPKDIRYLPQRSFIPKSITVKRVLDDFNVDISDMTEYFPELEKNLGAKLKSLSTGERRIIEIFVILTSETKFCILDEPFSQVMPLHVDTIKKLIRREKVNKGILLSDHMYRHIIDICDDLYVISGGKTHLTKSIEDIETLGYTRISDNN